MKFKQVIVVRADLGMGRGKIAAQVAHASVLGAINTYEKDRSRYLSWLQSGMEKVVLRVKSLEELMEVKRKADECGLHSFVVEDMGRTQLPPQTVTCICIGPSSETTIDKVTGSLKLL